jgi:hypothetical protein
MASKKTFVLNSKLSKTWFVNFITSKGRISSVMIVRGRNEISEEVYESGLKNHPLFKNRFASGDVHWIKGPEGCEETYKFEAQVVKQSVDVPRETEEAGETSLESESTDEVATEQASDEQKYPAPMDVNVSEARWVIQQETDLSKLEEWQSKESRKSVLTLISNRIDELTTPKTEEAEVK